MQTTGNGINVLLIDDDEGDFILIRELLSEASTPEFKVEWAGAYQTGLDTILCNLFDICLLDFQPDGRNGLELLEEAVRAGCRTPIILLTGRGDYKVDLQDMKTGAADCLVKEHLSAPLLERSIRYAIERKRTEEELREYRLHLEDLVRRRTEELETAIHSLETEVDECKQTDEKLRESESKYRELVQNANSAIIRWKSDGVVTFFNEYAQALFGYTQEEVIGKHVNILVPEKESTGGDLTSLVEDIVNYPERYAGNVNENICRDGRRVWMAWTNKPVLDENGRVMEILAVGTDITARRQAEEMVRRQNAILEAINRIFREALTCETVEELGNACLGTAEELTQSRFGFIGKIGSNGLLHDIAMSDPGWELCTMYDKSGHRRPPGCFKLHGLYGRVLLDGKSLIANDPASHPDSIGIPQGHPPLKSFLGAPLIQNGKTIGMIALGNREGGYTQVEQQALEAIAPAIVQALLRKKSEKAFRESEERLRLLGDNLPESAIYQYAHEADGKMRFLYFSAGIERLNGVSVQDVLRDVGTLHRQVPPEYLHRLVEAESRSSREISDFDMEVPMRRPDGEVRWMRLHSRPRRLADGRIVWDGVQIDVTERKHAEEAIRLHLAITETVEEGIFLVGVDDNVIKWTNRKFEEMFGYGSGEMIGMHVDEVNAPTDKTPMETRISIVEPLLQDGEWHGEIKNIKKDGTHLWCHIHVSLFDHPEFGKVMVSAHTDITDRKRMEEELRKALEEAARRAAELNAALESLAEGVVFYDMDHSISHINPSAVRILGFSEDEVRLPSEERVKLFRLLTKDGRAPKKEELPGWRALQGEVLMSDELILLPKGADQPLHLLTSASPIRMADGEVVGAIQTLTDISHRKQMEEEIRRARDDLELRVQERTAELETTMRKLEESNRALQDFASIASHDLQEPLRKVVSFGARLGHKYSDSLGDEGKDYLDRMLSATGRMQSLLTSLLEYSRVTTKAEPFVTIQLGDLIGEILSDLEVRIEQSGGKVETGELPAIEADPTQMRQLFQNLIGNALKFHKEGEKPVVKVYAYSINDHQEILVEDNGIGFEEQYLDKIFAPFQRLHGRSSIYEGTGMGLAICKKIVERHNGSITAQSRPGEGAAFIVKLPIKQATERP